MHTQLVDHNRSTKFGQQIFQFYLNEKDFYFPFAFSLSKEESLFRSKRHDNSFIHQDFGLMDSLDHSSIPDYKLSKKFIATEV